MMASESDSPVEELHDDVRQPLGRDAVVVDEDGVLGLELGRGAGLDLEAGARLRLAGELRLDELDGDARPERLVDALPHRPHAARADEAQDAVLARDELPLQGGGVGGGRAVAHRALCGERIGSPVDWANPARRKPLACAGDAPTHAPDVSALVGLVLGSSTGCDDPQNKAGPAGSGAAPSRRPPRRRPSLPRAPDIVIDGASVAVGSDRVAERRARPGRQGRRVPQGAADDRGKHGQRRRHAQRQAFAGRGRGLRAAQGQGERRRPQDRGARRDDAVDAGVVHRRASPTARRPRGSRRTRRSRSGPRAAARPSASRRAWLGPT